MSTMCKGIRTLSPEAADRLMQALGVTVAQLMWLDDGATGTDISAIREVPLLRHRIGPGASASFQIFRGYIPFPARIVNALTDPVTARLAADLVLPPEVRAGDLVLLDQNRGHRQATGSSRSCTANSCWVVAENNGLRVRYVRRVRGGLVVGTDPDPHNVRSWRPIALDGREVSEIVRARIVWIGRELEEIVAGSSGAEPSGSPGKGD